MYENHKRVFSDGGDYSVLDPPVITGDEYVEPPGMEVEGEVIEPDACIECGYDLRGSLESERCPECGTHIVTSIREFESRRMRRALIVAELSSLRWIAYCILPMIGWVIFAFIAYRSNNDLLQWMIFPSGLILGFGGTIFGSVQASEEATVSGGLGVAFLVLVSLCILNFGILILVLSRLQ